jgi:hypothetical protein
MKKFTLLFFLALNFGLVSAQVTEKEADLKKISGDTLTGWKTGGMATLNFGQAALSAYWAAGGQNSISLNAVTGLFANYKKGNSSWDNTLNLGYGLLKQGKHSRAMKTDDKIDFSSKYGKKAGKNLYYAALLNFKTQFADGFDYSKDSTHAISKFMAPGYLILAVGLDYKPNEHFSAFLAPLTEKFTFVNDQTLADAGAFGVDAAQIDTITGNITKHGKEILFESGGYLKIAFKQDLIKNVNLQTELDLFSNYLKNPQNIVVNWDILIAMKINKYMNANISTQLIYDDKTKFQIDGTGTEPPHFGPRLQWKEMFTLGISVLF